MEFGIAVATAADSWKVVKRAEELGFSHAWFYDTQMLCADCFVAMGAAAVQTSRIRLGTGVLIPTNRIAPVTANAFASLNQLAPGRIDFGVGTGFTGRRTMGLGAMKQGNMEEYIRVVMALLDGETPDFEVEGKKHKITFLNPELKLINLRDEVKLHISAYGPRGRALTARLGAGWLNFVGDVAEVKPDIIWTLLNNEYIPVIAPIGAGEDGESYNINADYVAGEVAGALRAEKLLLLTDVEGIYRDYHDKSTFISSLTFAAAKKHSESVLEDRSH